MSNTALPYLAEVDFDIPKSKAGCPAKMSLSTVNYLQSSEDDFHQKKFNTHIKYETEENNILHEGASFLHGSADFLPKT